MDVFYGMTIGGSDPQPQIIELSNILFPKYSVPSGQNFTYMGSIYNVWGGINAIAADNKYIYTIDGFVLKKRNITNANVIDTVLIPNGVAEQNAGICIDDCGNVYIGSKTGVYKFDSTLIQTSFAPTPGAVYDITINNNGEILACGNGFLASLNLATCGIYSCACAKTSSSVSNCLGGNSGSATVNTSGGSAPFQYLWSPGGQTTQTVTGLSIGSYTVTITSSTGCVTTAPVEVTPVSTTQMVYNIPCDTSSVGYGGMISLSPYGGVSPYNFSWSTGETTSQIFDIFDPGIYSVVITDSIGCTDTLNINIVQDVPYDWAPSYPHTICIGDTISFVYNITADTSDINELDWDFGDGTFEYWDESYGYTDSIMHMNYVYTSPGTYYIYLNIYSNNYYCLQEIFDSIIVSDVPIVNIGNDTTLCGDSLFLNAENIGATYLWSTGDSTQLVTVNSNGNYWVEVNQGCINADTITINFNSLTFNLGNDTTICDDEFEITSGINGLNYLWSTTDTTPNINVNSSGTYWLEVNDGVCFEKDTINLVLNTLSLQLKNDTSFCGGSFQINSGISGVNYLWSTTDTTQNINVNSSGVYWLEINDGICLDKDTININLNPFPTADAGSDKYICSSATATLNASSTTSGVSYSWSGPLGFISNQQNPVVSNPGIYILTVTDSNCSSTDTVAVISSPDPIALFTPNPTSGNPPLLVNLLNNSQYATTYFWSFGDGNTSSIANPGNTYISPGTYTIILIASNNNLCPDTTLATIVVFDNFSLNIPNVFTPNNDQVNDIFTISSSGLSSLQGEIFDRWGLKLFQWNNIKGGWDGNTVSGKECPEGTYYYIIKAKGFGVKEHTDKGSFTLIR